MTIARGINLKSGCILGFVQSVKSEKSRFIVKVKSDSLQLKLPQSQRSKTARA
jgi:hypothetical protein